MIPAWETCILYIWYLKDPLPYEDHVANMQLYEKLTGYL